MHLPIRNIAITFKKLELKDMPLFFEWVKKPHIARWWKSDTYEEFVEKYQSKINGAADNYSFPFIIHIDEKPIGWIQYYLADKTDDGWWMKQHGQPVGTIGMDIIIGETEYIGKGFGTMLIKKFVEKIFKETAAPKIIIDPDVENKAAIRCYEKVGFQKVKEIDTPEFFDEPPGKSLLMELKQSERIT
jgi:RimJ/RimL family protein N-acetyltransferase